MNPSETKVSPTSNVRKPEEKSSSKVSVLKYTLLSGLVLAMVYLVLSLYYSIFFFNPETLPYNFLKWRVDYVDKALLKSRYSPIDKNRIPSDDKAMNKSVEMAQKSEVKITQVDGKAMVIKEKGVFHDKNLFVHLPRSEMYFHTHTTEVNFNMNEAILRYKLDAFKQCDPKTFSHKGMTTGASIVDVVRNHSGIKPVLAALYDLLSNVNERKDGYFISDYEADISDQLYDSIIALTDSLEIEEVVKSIYPKRSDLKLTKTEVKNVIVAITTAKPGIVGSYAYSRIIDLVVPTVAEVNFEGIEQDDKNRVKHILRMIAKIVVNVSKHPIKDSGPSPGFFEKHFGNPIYGKLPNDSEENKKLNEIIEKDDENIAKLLAELRRISA